MTITLYDAKRSNNCRKVRLLASELGITFSSQTLDFQAGEQRGDAYRAKNPNGKIPTLDDDGFLLWESGAILYYLAAKRSDHQLVPSDAHARALLDQWMFWWASHVEPPLMTLLWERRLKAFFGQGEPNAAVAGYAEGQLARFLPILDAQLATREHILGPLSIVDFYAAPSLEMAPMLSVDLTAYPHVGAWLLRLQSRPGWAEA